MTEEITQQLTTQIADIIRKVGKREDKIDQVAEAVDFGALANRLISEEGPVRDAAIKAVIGCLRGLEIESGDETSDKIIEAIDFASLVKGMSDDSDIRESLRGAVKNVLEGLSDDDGFPDKVYQALHFDDAEELLKGLTAEDRAEIIKAVAAKALEFVKDRDLSDCNDDVTDAIEEAAFSTERINECLAEHRAEVSQKLWESIEGMFGPEPSEDIGEHIQRAVFESEAFKQAAEAATEKLVRGGRVDSLVEEAAKAILAGKDNGLRRELQSAISSKLVDRIAGSVVDRLFEPPRRF